MMEISSDDLKTAIRRKLESTGAIDAIKSRIRAEVFHSIEEKSIPLPDKPAEVYLAHEILKEFLTYFHLPNTLSVFLEESGQPTEMRTDRDFVAQEIGFTLPPNDERDQLPLLIMILKQLQAEKAKYQTKFDSSVIVEDGV